MEYACSAPDMPLPCSVADNFRCKPGKCPFWKKKSDIEKEKAREPKPKKYVVRFTGMAVIEAKDEDEAKKLVLKNSVPKCISVNNVEEFKGGK